MNSNTNNPTTLDHDTVNCLKECVRTVADVEKKLPPQHTLHLFIELPTKQNNEENPSMQSKTLFQVHVLHSQSVSFKKCSHAGAQMICNGFGLFKLRQPNNSSINSNTVSQSPSEITGLLSRGSEDRSFNENVQHDIQPLAPSENTNDTSGGSKVYLPVQIQHLFHQLLKHLQNQ